MSFIICLHIPLHLWVPTGGVKATNTLSNTYTCLQLHKSTITKCLYSAHTENGKWGLSLIVTSQHVVDTVISAQPNNICFLHISPSLLTGETVRREVT